MSGRVRAQSVFSEYVRYAIANIVGMLGLSCYILADTFFVSKGMGSDGLAALNFAVPVYTAVHGCGLMLGMGGATRYALAKGQGDDAQADRAYTATLWMTLGFSVAFVALGLGAADGMARLLGADGPVRDMTRTYLRFLLLFSPAFLLNDVLLCFVRNDGAPRLAMCAMLTGSLFNIVFDYIMIFPLRLGILGAVLATGVSPLISVGVLATHWLRRRNGFRPVRAKIAATTFGSILSLGVPSLVGELSGGIVMIVFNLVFLRQAGNIGVAAYGVVANLAMVVIAVYTGLAQGVQPLFSRACGTGDDATLARAARYAIATVAALALAIYAILCLCASPIAGIFNRDRDPQLQSIATFGLRLYFIATPFIGWNIVIAAYFTSVKRAAPAHAIALLRGLVLIVPTIFALESVAGLTGVWLALPLTEALVCALGVAVYVRARAASGGKRRRQ